MRHWWLVVLVVLGLSAVAQAQPGTTQGPQPTASKMRDLMQIRQSGVLRVLVNQSRSVSGVVSGQSIGSANPRLQAFVQELNQGLGKGQTVRLQLIPLPKSLLLDALLRGEGDLMVPGELFELPAAAHGQVTRVSVQEPVPLVVVSHASARRYQQFSQMAGRVLVLPVGSVAEGPLLQINQKLRLGKLPPLMLERADPSLAPEDVLEMLHAGIYNHGVVELALAQRWAKVLPKLRIDRQLDMYYAAPLRWFLRRDASDLLASVERFNQRYKPAANDDAWLHKVYRNQYRVHYPLNRADRQRLQRVRPTLQKYAKEQNLDWLALAAVAYKESSLNPNARGANGIAGLMQMSPATARAVGVSNAQPLDNNVKAASLYMARLRRLFFNSPQIAEHERMAFIWAAYNLGPQRVQNLRALAKQQGLNPNQWFFQVERVAADKYGQRVAGYAASVNKYYQAFERDRDFLELR